MHFSINLSLELEIHQSKGFFDKDVLLLTLEDPKARVGSGGATANALLVVAEHLSAKAGYEVKCTINDTQFYGRGEDFYVERSTMLEHSKI